MPQSKENITALQGFLKQAIETRLKEAADEEFELMKTRLDKRKAEIVTGIVLHVQKMVDVQTIQERVIITIK